MRGIELGTAFGVPVKLTVVLNDVLGSGIDPEALGGVYRPWLLGGLAAFRESPENPRHELVIAVAGPVVSVGVGVASYGLFLSMPAGFDAGLFVFGYVAVLNVALAAFNMLPAFPMDGGRVFRALLARNRPHVRATRLAARVGKVLAVLLGVLGLFANPMLILLAVFVYVAASNEAEQTSIRAAFEDVTVGDVMTSDEHLHVVSPDATIAELTERMFRERHTGYPVVEEGELVGLVRLDDTREVRERARSVRGCGRDDPRPRHGHAENERDGGTPADSATRCRLPPRRPGPRRDRRHRLQN